MSSHSTTPRVTTRTDLRRVPRVLYAVCILSALVRAAFVVWSGPNAVRTMEDYSIAVNVAEGRGYSLGDAHDFRPTALKAPVYPLFLAGIHRLSPENDAQTSAVIQHLIFAFCPLLLYRLFSRFVNHAAALGASLALALHPSYFVYPSTLEPTSLFIPLCLIWLYTLERFHDHTPASRSTASLALAALMSSTVILCQPVSLPIVLYSLFRAIPGGRHRIAVAFMMAMCFAPWTVRNQMMFNEPIVLKAPVWMNVYMGFDARSHGIRQLDVIDTAARRRIDSLQRVTTDVEMEEEYRQVVIQAIADHPAQYVEKTLVQAFRYWSIPPSYDHALGDPTFIIVRILPVVILLVLCIPVMRTYQDYRVLLRPVVLTLAYFTAVYSLTHTTNIRFKLDVEWLQCVIAGIGLCILLNGGMTAEQKTGVANEGTSVH